jgi:hypothetical protein
VTISTKVKRLKIQMELLNLAKEKILNYFNFLNQLGYEFEKSELKTNILEIYFRGRVTNKDINFLITNSERTNRFFITISIIRNPYLEVNDFVDFDIFLKKNKIAFKDSLVANELSEVELNQYILEYSNLFKNIGGKLIATDEQFPHYFPEWT